MPSAKRRRASAEALASFSPLTRVWFQSVFDAPTPAQAGAWKAISAGSNALVVAPTGSGKTLAAFLWALDRIATEPPPDPATRCRVVYVSPLKALAADVERNLRSPLAGMVREAVRSGLPQPSVDVGVRTGDTSPAERRKQAKHPPDVLITTPESLFLILTSQSREGLRGVDTVILDEVHAVAGNKRGAHLAISLERLDELLDRPAQRIGLSATVQPVDEVARFLGGVHPVRVVAPKVSREIALSVVVPVQDMTAPTPMPSDPHSAIASGPLERASVWPHVEREIEQLLADHESTLVFANSRRLAEKLTARLNEIHAERGTTGEPADVARAHHGSVSHEQRAIIEGELKAGRLRAVVATSSLELGIDMGALDLVVQVEAPSSVTSGLQRIGRAGHQVGETSHGVIFPKHRADLLATAVVAERMRHRQLEPTSMPRNPLDVLAQQIVAAVSLDDWHVEQMLAMCRRAAPFRSLPESAFRAVLDMLAGRYPSDAFAELRPRIVWDRATGILSGRPGAQRLAVTSGGTIPDRGLFPVFVVGDAGSRVGELDEEMVYESRVGDVIALGSTSWRVEEITHDRVLVSRASGQPGRLPFWHGDSIGRSPALGQAIGEFARRLDKADDQAARDMLAAGGLDRLAAANLVDYVREQRAATHWVPSDRTIVIERFRDELGDWRLVVHSPYGARVNAPWALAIGACLLDAGSFDTQVMHSDDGIIVRLPDTDDDKLLDDAAASVRIDPDEITDLLTTLVGSSALFASRFRECAARSLLLPRRDPGKRTPLWQQRQRSASLLAVASRFPSFPVALETVRECLQDVYDIPALTEILSKIRSGQIRVVEVTTTTPSPFARGLLFGYVAAYLYEGDSPLAERRAAALTLDSELLGELLGYTQLRELLDADSIAAVEAEIGYLTPGRRARSAEDLADMLRVLGPMPGHEWSRRGVEAKWIEALLARRRAIRVRVGGLDCFAGAEDASRLRDALGCPLPVGLPDAFLEPHADPMGDLVARFARTHGPFTARDVADHFGLGEAVAATALDHLSAAGRLVSGEFRPGTSGQEWCDAEVLRRIRRRSIAALRKEVEPVATANLAQFLPQWQAVGSDLRGTDGVARVVDLLAGCPMPASALESLVLPSRVGNYATALLDELCSSGEVVWSGAGKLAGGDCWVSLAPADLAADVLPDPVCVEELAPGARQLVDALSAGGAWTFAELASKLPQLDPPDLMRHLWDLVWSGLATADTMAPLRAMLASSGRHRRARDSARAARRGGIGSRARVARLARSGVPSRASPPTVCGRWSLLPPRTPDATVRLASQAAVLLERHGILTRGSLAAERFPGGFAAAYRILTMMEDSGAARRGYIIEGLGAAQFALPGAVDRIRDLARQRDQNSTRPNPGPAVLAATDPANPFGAALPWPDVTPQTTPPAGPVATGHRPGRKAGSVVAIVDAELIAYLERGGRSLLTFGPASTEPAALTSALTGLARAAHAGSIGRISLDKINGQSATSTEWAEQLGAAGFVATPRGWRPVEGRRDPTENS